MNLFFRITLLVILQFSTVHVPGVIFKITLKVIFNVSGVFFQVQCYKFQTQSYALVTLDQPIGRI